MGYIIKSKRYKMQDHYKYNVRAPRGPLSVALKIQPKLQVLLKQSTSPTTESATSARMGNGAGRQAAAVQNHNLKKKELEWRRSKEKGSHTRTWTRSPAPSRTYQQLPPSHSYASLFLDHHRLNHCMIPYFRNLKLKFQCQNVLKCDNRTPCYVSLVC